MWERRCTSLCQKFPHPMWDQTRLESAPCSVDLTDAFQILTCPIHYYLVVPVITMPKTKDINPSTNISSVLSPKWKMSCCQQQLYNKH